MALEPSEEQLETLDHALYGDPPAREIWDLVEGMVVANQAEANLAASAGGVRPTPGEVESVVHACAFAIGKVSVMAKSSFDAESAAASLPLVVDVAWRLIRDQVLEEAAKRFKPGFCADVPQLLRAMKGTP